MKYMPAGEFKARCLRVMEDVKKYRVPVVITKKGRAVAKLVPPDAPAADVFGCMEGSARIVGDIEAPIFPSRSWSMLHPEARRRRVKPARARR